jgi:hypothetical protein
MAFAFLLEPVDVRNRDLLFSTDVSSSHKYKEFSFGSPMQLCIGRTAVIDESKGAIQSMYSALRHGGERPGGVECGVNETCDKLLRG